MKHYATVGPRLTLDITDKERDVAKDIKKEFKQILKELDEALKIIFDLRDAVVQERPSKDKLKNEYRGRFLRYKRKIVKKFNSFLKELKKTLEKLNEISDPEMIELRSIIISEFDELSDGVEALLDLLKDAGREGFTKSLERLCTQMERRKRSINSIIDDQMFGHIENDILGKMKISSLSSRIRRRTRILRKISTGSR